MRKVVGYVKEKVEDRVDRRSLAEAMELVAIAKEPAKCPLVGHKPGAAPDAPPL